jgi:hypothetical protein
LPAPQFFCECPPRVWQAGGVPGEWIVVDPPRELSPWERDVVARLAPEASEEAVEEIRVTDRCGCGCSSVGFAEFEHFPVAEGEAADTDGTAIWVMLFADRDETRLATLDVLRADGQPIQKLPPVAELEGLKTSAWKGVRRQGE